MSEILLTPYNGAIAGPIARLLGLIMDGIYNLMSMIPIENIGLSIIIFTIVIYLLLFPLTYRQQKFSKLQQKMQPELQAITKKYQGKKDQASMMAMNEETQAVYEKYGVSMMGSCLNMFIQLPLLFSLYRIFNNVPAYVSGVRANFNDLVTEIMATDGYQEKMTGLVDELRIFTQPRVDFTVTDTASLSNYVVDVLYKLNSNGWDTLRSTFPLLGDTISTTYEKVSNVNNFILMNISDTPWQIITTNFKSHNFLLVLLALMIPVTSYLSQVINMSMIPQTTSPGGNEQADAMAQQMKMMNKTMPLFSLVMCFTVPVGLGIYWIAGAVVRTVQQYFLNRHFEKVNLDDIIKKNQEKAKKKRAKMGISENQISSAARMNTRQMVDASKKQLTSEEKELQIEKANAARTKAKPGSMSAKANLVREYNERNNKK